MEGGICGGGGADTPMLRIDTASEVRSKVTISIGRSFLILSLSLLGI